MSRVVLRGCPCIDIDGMNAIERMHLERDWRVRWLEGRGWTVATRDAFGGPTSMRDPRAYVRGERVVTIGKARLRQCARERFGSSRRRAAA